MAYSIINDGDNYSDFCTEIISDMNSKLVPIKVSSNESDGNIVKFDSISVINGKPDFMVSVVFETGVCKKYALLVAVSRFISIDCNILDVINMYGFTVGEVYKQHREVEKIARAKKLEEEAVRLKKEKEEREAQQEEKKRLASIRAKINEFKLQVNAIPKDFSITNETYYAVGWLANHISTISATLPDYLEPFFTREFGGDCVHKVIDSKRKTTGGYAQKWSLDFNMTFRKKDTPNIPASVMLSTNSANTVDNNKIRDTSFISYLVKQYGFKFGKKQDIDEIRKNVPSTYMNDFELGLSA